VLVLLGQATLLLGVGVALGLRPHPAGLLLVPLLVLVGVLLASCSYGLALVLREENSLASTLNLVVLPLLLSGITLPLTLAPHLLRRIANANPGLRGRRRQGTQQRQPRRPPRRPSLRAVGGAGRCGARLGGPPATQRHGLNS
jgi:hypothetical protein